MSNNNLPRVIYIIVGAVVLIGAGCYLGIFLEKRNFSQVTAELNNTKGTLEAVNSVTTTYPSVEGMITNISDKIITLNGKVSVETSDDTKVYLSFDDYNDRTKAAFNQIKVNDLITAIVNVSPDGRIQGRTIIINPLNAPSSVASLANTPLFINGKVIDISGKTINFENNPSVEIINSTDIYFNIHDVWNQKKTSLEQIKANDVIFVSYGVSSDGKKQARVIMINPPISLGR